MNNFTASKLTKYPTCGDLLTTFDNQIIMISNGLYNESTGMLYATVLQSKCSDYLVGESYRFRFDSVLLIDKNVSIQIVSNAVDVEQTTPDTKSDTCISDGPWCSGCEYRQTCTMYNKLMIV